MRAFLAFLSIALTLSRVNTASAAPVPYKVAPAMPDSLQALDPSAVRIEGWLGERIDLNVSGRLEVVDTAPLLAGFIRKPGSHPWIGEHVGKWIHAATLAWAYTGNSALKVKLDSVVAELIASQEPDGYLGTYIPSQRFGLYPDADWDVWCNSYSMIGLLTYYKYTGNAPALEAARRVADLLIATFPARKSILSAGTHVGMAATSVLVPVVELYRLTGDERYLAFARYIVAAYDEPGGPRIVQTLLARKGVSLTANGKAYEMLANLMGICDLARATGDRQLLLAVTNGWEDIVRNRLYLTGTASNHEHFGDDHQLPNGEDAQIGETCVTTTWIQLNQQLLQLTGGAVYADEIERSLYNHLTAAQNPTGGRLVLLHGAARHEALRQGHYLLPFERASRPRAGPDDRLLPDRGHGGRVHIRDLAGSFHVWEPAGGDRPTGRVPAHRPFRPHREGFAARPFWDQGARSALGHPSSGWRSPI